jgi:membrane protein DedA with SNARE-associated domain
MDFLLRHGYIAIFVAVFIEQIGLPIPSGPVLLAAGALAGFHRLNLAPALALAAAASLICDSLWFTLGRRRGGSVLKFVCRVAIEPDTCVSKTHSAYLRYGPESLLISKFLPWFGTLGPPLAGMFNLAVWRFLLIDAGGACLGPAHMSDRLAVPPAIGRCRGRIIEIRRRHRIRSGGGRSGVSDFQMRSIVA